MHPGWWERTNRRMEARARPPHDRRSARRRRAVRRAGHLYDYSVAVQRATGGAIIPIDTRLGDNSIRVAAANIGYVVPEQVIVGRVPARQPRTAQTRPARL
jgi:hypothetical protein